MFFILYMSYSIVSFFTSGRFNTPNYTSQVLRLRESFIKDPFCKHVYLYSEDDISDFIDSHPSLFHPKSRGFGYMSWKAFVIQHCYLNHFSNQSHSDFLIYVDADLELLPNISPSNTILPLINKFDCLFFHIGQYKLKNYTQGRWTKMNTFIKMNQNNDSQLNHFQIMSGIQIYSKSSNSLRSEEHTS